MASLIEQAKRIPASAIAKEYGVTLIRRGPRYWACCPLHTDQHPSMCFYPDGSWHCFSCSAGGDSVALLASMMNLSQYDAAKLICDQYKPPVAAVARNPYTWKAERVRALRETIRQADEYTGQYSVKTSEAAWKDPIFRAAILAKARANSEIDDLYAADRQELKQMMVRGCGAIG